jgi:CBS domain-containing protein
MLVRDLMTRDVTSCVPGNNLAQIAELMWNNGCGSLPILDGLGKVAGMITDRDVCIALGTRDCKAADVLVQHVARPVCYTCSPDDHVRSALKTMATYEVGRLPVVDGTGRLVGILSLDDIVFRAGGGCSDLTDREIINTMRALTEERVHQRQFASEVETELRRPHGSEQATRGAFSFDNLGLRKSESR